MTAKKNGDKGLKTEELLRTYFLRAGFFVIRSVPLRSEGNDLTDIDLWVYERSTTLARRRTVIDIKDKQIPQAAERLFFIKGLAQVIHVEGAGVVTTDNRPALRDLARRNGILWIDGTDLQRLKNSDNLVTSDRISEEILNEIIKQVDRTRRSKFFRDTVDRIKASVADRFGAACTNTALEAAQVLAKECVAAYPDSPAALLAGRLTYLSGAVAAAALDFTSGETALRPAADRLRSLTDAIRFGSDSEGTLAHLRWAEAAIRDYVPNGSGVAQMVRDRFTSDLDAVPAEGLAEIAVKLTKTDALFAIARSLEQAAYAIHLPTFDELPSDVKGFLGAVLDFVDVQRPEFAKAWAPHRMIQELSGQTNTVRTSTGSTHQSNSEDQDLEESPDDAPRMDRLL